MPEIKTIRLAEAAKEFNVATATIVEHLKKSGYDVENRPTSKLSEDMYGVLLKAFHKDKGVREQADQISIGTRKREEVALDERQAHIPHKREEQKEDVLIQSRLVGGSVGNAGVMTAPPKTEEAPAPKKEAKFEAPEPAAAPAPALVAESAPSEGYWQGGFGCRQKEAQSGCSKGGESRGPVRRYSGSRNSKERSAGCRH